MALHAASEPQAEAAGAPLLSPDELYAPYGGLAAYQAQMEAAMAVLIAPPPLPLPGAAGAAAGALDWVNRKQHARILKRREARARAELANKTVKARKPYLYESRHRHAANRQRNGNGKFLKRGEQAAPRAEEAVQELPQQLPAAAPLPLLPPAAPAELPPPPAAPAEPPPMPEEPSAAQPIRSAFLLGS
jgi:hypothetical protein